MTAPETIDRYKIEEELGRGGMATVYLAHDPLFERTVAIKVMPPEFARDREFRARFIREARTIAALEHPAIVPVYDYGEDYDRPYLVMRYMPGGSLSDKLKQGAVSLAETAVILQRISSALDAAHSRGLIHRDLKPGNILFDQYNNAYLADFGIVHVAASDEALTATGSLVGTPSYMSPEQVHGDLELDGRSDIYALGVILFQMLTGHVPYAADTPAKTMMQHVLDPVPDILNARPDLPTAFDTIINKAMAKDRDGRYPTGGELSAALNKAIAEKTINRKQPIENAPPPVNAPAPAAAPEPEPIAAPAPAPVASGPVETPPFPSAQPKPAGGRRLSPVFWVGIGALVLICVGMVGATIWIFSNLPNEATAVIPDRPSVVTVEVMSENDIAQTSAVEALITQAMETAAPEPTAAEPPPTSDPARESALATRQALETAAAADAPAIERPASSLAPLFGPSNGEMPHDDDEFIESTYADVSPADFVAAAEIANPSTDEWDFGLVFRQLGADDEMRLVIHSSGSWNLNDRQGSDDVFIHEGELGEWLNRRKGGSNTLLVAALGERGYFFLNGRYIATLDLSSRTQAGDLALGTGFYANSEQPGASTAYANFTVWPGSALFGPENGALEHNEDDFIKTFSSDTNLYNFIAAAEMGVPYAASKGSWDVGFSFRDADVGEQFWLIVESSGAWSFIDRQHDEDTVLDEGVVPTIYTGSGETNQLLLIALDDRGYFFVNDELISELDLSSRVNAGNLSVATAYFFGDEIAGQVTTFTDFTIWPLP